jgi:cell cycle checkpoint protein
MDYPNDRDVLETFECSTMVKFTYRVAHISCALRALQASLKTSLRIDDEGLLSLQFVMAGGPGAFLEFRVSTWRFCLLVDSITLSQCLPMEDP